MINLDENVKSEAQIRLQEKLERDRKRLQEQIKKEHKQVEELRRKSRAMIGDLFAEHLPDFYNFEAAELKEIIDTAMTQKATNDKITAIRNAAMSAKPVIKAEPQVKGDEEPLSVNAHGRHIFMHISDIDIKMLLAAWTPKYYSDSAGRRRFMCKSIMIIRKENPPAWEWKIPMTSCRGLQIFCQM